MANGSLHDRLWAQGNSDMLPWPQGASICSGLLLAVEHLHTLDIIHSNVKSANVLLDQHLNPKLAHPVAHPHPDNKKTKYTVMRTHLFQASAAYLPEHFIRVGQLTKQVDIFSCGIVSISSSAHRLAVSVGLAWSYSRGCWTVASRPDPRQRHL